MRDNLEQSRGHDGDSWLEMVSDLSNMVHPLRGEHMSIGKLSPDVVAFRPLSLVGDHKKEHNRVPILSYLLSAL